MLVGIVFLEPELIDQSAAAVLQFGFADLTPGHLRYLLFDNPAGLLVVSAFDPGGDDHEPLMFFQPGVSIIGQARFFPNVDKKF